MPRKKIKGRDSQSMAETYKKWNPRYYPLYLEFQWGAVAAWFGGFKGERVLRKVKMVNPVKPHECYLCLKPILLKSDAITCTYLCKSKHFGVYYHKECYIQHVGNILKGFRHSLIPGLLEDNPVDWRPTGSLPEDRQAF